MIESISKAAGFHVETLPTFGLCIFMPQHKPASFTPHIKAVVRETLLLVEQYGVEYVAKECGISLES